MHEALPPGPVTPEQFRRIREIFEAALEQPITDRRRWLQAACGNDSMLMHQVERMLAADSQRHHLLDVSDHATLGAASGACAACGGTITLAHGFCPFCGAPTAGAGPLYGGRFNPGALFAGRFRIVALQGRGGMGQVYRAHDLELGQPVALKFLTAFRSDQRARTRLRTEVRLARQISHPNVCRVYDIGEANGELYLSMEYIDGENLAVLLERVGRLAVHKGIEIARKVCAGLAAAHTKRVLHRDLKPGNIMVDNHGEVRIMDFGLAAVVEQQLDAADVRSGTPAYMAPEQLDGREATARSDIYALGLVLYELFTGRPAFEGRDAAELRRLRETQPSTTPSTLVPDLEPALERAILRCLEPDPRMRPASALEVAASLPGGDPLAEALAAGETPSPDLVAAAGPDTVLRPAVAVGLLGLIGLCLIGVVLLTEQTQMVSMVPMENPPEVLAAKARELVRSLGDGESATDAAYGFRHERGYRAYWAGQIFPDRGSTAAQWKTILRVRPAPISFWYAQSDGPLIPPVAATGAARPLDSLPAVRGGVSVDLDLDGRLLRVVRSPIRQSAPVASAAIPDWQPLFQAAGLSLEHFEETLPVRGLAIRPDTRVVWTGSYNGRPDLPVRIEAGVSGGTITSFDVLFPWTNREPLFPQPTDYRGAALRILIWIAPFFVARHNWLNGRVDIRGALRIGAVALFADMGSLLFNAHDPLNAFVTRPVFWLALSLGAWAAAVYMALEPWVRRRWPHAMIGWARVVAGRWRDPLVARDVLVALALITAFRCVFLAAVLGDIYLGAPPLSVGVIESLWAEFVLSHITRPQFNAANMLSSVSFGIELAAASFFLLTMFRALIRNPWLSTAAFCVLSYTWSSLQPEFRGGWVGLAIYPIFLAGWLFGALRYGFLTVVVAACTYRILAQSILTTDFGAWYGRSSLIAVVLVMALAIWAFRVSLGNQALLKPRPVKA